MQASIAAELEVERRLDDFARARLTPSAASKARSRARVMREARLAFADQAAGTAAAAHHELARSASHRTLLRRGAGLALAAALSIGMVGGAMAASTAGGPLYGTRIWLETVTLPSNAADRAAAEIRRLDMRIAELEAAVGSNDRAAVAAALAAYEEIADEALTFATTDAAIERLQAALDRHIAVLQRVAAQVPPQAADSINRNIEKAIDHNDAAIQRILSKSNNGPGNGGAGNENAGPGTNNGGTNNGGGNGAGGSGGAGGANGGTNNGGTNNGGTNNGGGSGGKPPASQNAAPTAEPTPDSAAPEATDGPPPADPSHPAPGKKSPKPDKTPPGGGH